MRLRGDYAPALACRRRGAYGALPPGASPSSFSVFSSSSARPHGALAAPCCYAPHSLGLAAQP